MSDARVTADARKHTCSPCLRGAHASCTVKTCAHFGCDAPRPPVQIVPTAPDAAHRCPACGKGFSYKAARDSHLSNKHPDYEANEETPMAEPARNLTNLDPEGLVWEDPPVGRTRQPLVSEAHEAALRARPGQWARIRTFPAASSANTAASNARKGKANVPEGKWEFRAGKKDSGSALYARFLGDDA